ncbi:hypothetical protein MP638_001106 [Amoeboaphelidium occidentale]|nr:hypothetical protein MP638_001106 [Amoeboaphelidium occidentale]
MMLVLLLGAGVLTMYFLVFPLPTVGETTATIDGGVNTPIQANLQTDPITISMIMKVSADVTSYSAIPLTISSIKSDLFMNIPNSDERAPIGTAREESITLAPKSTTKVTIPATITVNGSPNDPVVRSLLDSCANNKKLSIHYIAYVSAYFASNVKVQEDDYEVECPVDLNTLGNTVLNALQNQVQNAGNQVVEDATDIIGDVTDNLPPVKLPDIPIDLPNFSFP